MERKHRALLLALPTVLTLLFFFVAPMVYILVHTLHENGFSDFVDFFGDPFYRNILWVTLRVSLVSTAISLVLGYPTAFYMARTKSRMKQVMMIVILFPFLVSAVVRSYGWMVILGTNGLLNQLLQSLGLISAPLKILNTETAVIIGMIHLLVPYMVLSLVGVLQSIDPNVEYAAYSLGGFSLPNLFQGGVPSEPAGHHLRLRAGVHHEHDLLRDPQAAGRLQVPDDGHHGGPGDQCEFRLGCGLRHQLYSAGSDPAGADRGGAVHLRTYETYGRRKVICAKKM